VNHGYNVHPNLESYDALTLRGIAKFVLLLGFLIGVQYLADRYGVDGWLMTGLGVAWIGLGLKIVWIGMKAWKSGDYPPGIPEEPRYSETTSTIRFVSPRVAAMGEIVCGLFVVVSEGILRLFQVWPGSAG
jgi:hypothetical protein